MSGMRQSLEKFRNDINNCIYDVVIVTESWLQEQHLNLEFLPQGWTIYRKDRSLRNNTDDSLGGGVFIAVRDSLHSEEVLLTQDAETPFDMVACKLNINNKSIFFSSFYIPPRSSLDDYIRLANEFLTLTNLTNNDDIFIFGDANLPNIHWTSNEFQENLYDPIDLNSNHYDFLTNIFSQGYFQINNFQNIKGNVLDLIFTNVTSNFTLDEALLTITKKTSVYHKILNLTYFFNESKQNTLIERTLVYDFEKAAYDEINTELNNLNLDLSSNCIQQVTESFYTELISIIKKYVPTKIKCKLTCPAHFDKSLRILRNKRNKAFKRYKNTKNISDYNIFINLREQFIIEEQQALSLHRERTALKLLDEPKEFWNFIKERRNNKGYPSAMKYGNSVSDNPDIIANMFKSHFKSVYQDPISFDPDDFEYISTREDSINSFNFSLEDIKKGINSLDIKKGPGPDLIPPSFLKKTVNNISKQLMFLFNLSLKSGIFPNFWKASFITPIFKNGNKRDVSNYRGIAILSTIPKLFEKLIVEKMYGFLKGSIDQNQHGFEAGKSTVTNLVQYTTFLRKNLEKKHHIDAIYTDFSKAFDKVDHKLLILKLYKYGIRGSLLKWIESYLTERIQIVRFNNAQSEPIKVTSSVPQGSHLGPVLFLIFINDLPLLFKDCEFSMYADDLKIYKVINAASDARILQDNLSILTNWCNKNGMHLNIGKCVVMSFARKKEIANNTYFINGIALNKVDSIKDLGVTLDSALSFNQHINKICTSGHALLGFIKRRAKEFDDIFLTKTLYCSLVRSILEYASIIWSPYTNERKSSIESIQKQFLLFALKPLGFTGYRLPRYEERLLLLNMVSLESRREVASTLFGFDLVRGNINSDNLCNVIIPNNHSHYTRFKRPLMEENSKTDYSMHSPLNTCIRNFNKYSIFYDPEMSREKFKNKILEKMKTLYS